MKIAITGSEGFIGKAIVTALTASHHEIVRIDILLGIDVLNLEQLSSIPEFDIVIHLASRLIIQESYTIPYSYYNCNVMGTLNILELCRIREKKMVFFSSYLYGHPQYYPIDELHPISALNPYAQSKLLSEQLCFAYNRDFNVSVIVFRPFNIYGVGQNPYFLIPNIIQQCKSGTVHLKDARPKRDYVYIEDVVNACVAAINYNKPGLEIFNIGSGLSFSIPQIINTIRIILNKNIEVVYSNEIRNNEILNTICDHRKAGLMLNWFPQITLEQGLREIINLQGRM